jgi:hypothetical protein
MDNYLDCWKININNNKEEIIKELKKYCEVIDVPFKLNKKINFSLIEKFVYDIAKFSCETKNINIELDSIHVYFCFKNINCINCNSFHVDTDEYEIDINKTITYTPIITNITYLNKNPNPTIFSNIKKNEKKSNNKNVCLSFPDELISIIFDGGNFYHGPLYYDDNEQNMDRSLLVVTIFEENYPAYVPNYEEDIFNYKLFRLFGERKRSDEIIFNINEPFLFFNNINNNIKFINIYNNHNDIYEKFLVDLFDSYDNCFTEIKKLIKNKINEESNIYILKYENENENEKTIDEINNIVYNSIFNNNLIKTVQTISDSMVDTNSNKCNNINECNNSTNSIRSLMDDNINYWDISFKNNESIHLLNLLNKCNIDSPKSLSYLLNHNKKKFDIIEKYVYDIAKFHLNKMNIELDNNIFIEFWFKNNGYLNMHIDSDSESVNRKGISKNPFLSCITYLNDNDIPTILTNISIDSYKFKNFKNKNLLFVFPKKLRHIAFNGGNYFHSQGNVFINTQHSIQERPMLLLNFWYKHKPLNRDYYTMNDFSLDIKTYSKDVDSVINFNKNLFTYKNIQLENDELVNFGFFQDILYDKKDDNIFNRFDSLLKPHFNNNEKIIILSSNKQQTEIKKTFFNTPLKIDYKKYINFKIIPNFIDSNYSNFIINEYEKYTNEFNINKKQDVEIENISCIFDNIMNNYIIKLFEIIKKEYNKDNLNILKIFISNSIENKYSIKNNNDKKQFIIFIILNNIEIIINNQNLKQGDMVIYYDYKLSDDLINVCNNKDICLLFINMDVL